MKSIVVSLLTRLINYVGRMGEGGGGVTVLGGKSIFELFFSRLQNLFENQVFFFVFFLLFLLFCYFCSFRCLLSWGFCFTSVLSIPNLISLYYYN